MGAPILLQDGKMESDLDANFHRILNLDTSNLPPSGQPPTIHPQQFQWLHDWDTTTGQWTVTQPTFDLIGGKLTFDQQTAINFLGEIQTGVWHAFPIEPAYLPTLDSIHSPANPVSMAGQRITNLADPINPLDAVNKEFMDLLLQGFNPKQIVRAATISSIGLTGLQTVNGVSLNVGDRVLVKDQSSNKLNGIWVVATSSWSRATDADHGNGDAGFTDQNSIDRGCYCTVIEGDTNRGTSWFQTLDVGHCANDPSGDPIEFVLFSEASSLTAGQAIDITGNVISVKFTANRTALSLSTGGIDIANNYVGQTSLTTLGTITTGTWHGNLITPTYGGTGINNGSFTTTLAGNFSTSLGVGAVSSTLNFVLADGATSVILPTTGTLATLAGAETIQNKRNIKRYAEIASNALPAINTNLVDIFAITNLGGPITSMTANLTGNPTDGQELVIWIHDDGTSRAISWGAKFTAGNYGGEPIDPPLPTVTTAGKWMFHWFMWNKQLTQWVLTNRLTSV